VDGWNVTKAELLECRQVESVDGLADMLQRRAACIAIVRRIRRFADADSIQNN